MADRYLADHLLPMDEGASLHSPGVVDVEDGRVTWSGPAADAPGRPDLVAHRLRGILMPGIVNTHAHTPMVLLRGAGEGLPVERWLDEVIWPRESRLTPEDVRWGMILGAAELLRNGITTSTEMYFFGEALVEGAVSVGLRCIVTAPLIEDDRLARFGSWEAQLAAMVDLRHRWRGEPLVEVGIGPHSAYAVSEQALRRVAETAAAEGMLVHIHVAEQRWEEEASLAERGRTTLSYLDSIGLLGARVLAAHCVWPGEGDLDLLKERRVGVAHCPSSNARHGSGVAPVEDMRGRGVPVGIGTDGPASHPRLDPFEEMRTAIRLARAHRLDAGLLGPVDALRMATREAAAALGRADLGRLEPGAWADMVLVRTTAPSFVPVLEPGDLVGHLVWAGCPEMVERVWVAGSEVVTGGRVRRADLGLAMAEATRRARRLADG